MQIKNALRPLLDHLAQHGCRAQEEYNGWTIAPVGGGANNLLYRIRGAHGDFAVKYTLRDERRRARREWQALQTVQAAGLAIAPTPILLDEISYPQPVVVQAWLEGEVDDAPPAADAEWRKLLEHHVQIHAISAREDKNGPLLAVLSADSWEGCLAIVWQQVQRIPPEHRPAEVNESVRRLHAMQVPGWPPVTKTLCRDDANIRNFIRRPGAWASVDWENSGWGDPAFEIADLITHPAYLDMPESRWEWVVATYCDLRGDPALEMRIRIYYRTMLVWWVARLARTLYEVPRGHDQRLVARPADWQADVLGKYQRYWGRLVDGQM